MPVSKRESFCTEEMLIRAPPRSTGNHYIFGIIWKELDCFSLNEARWFKFTCQGSFPFPCFACLFKGVWSKQWEVFSGMEINDKVWPQILLSCWPTVNWWKLKGKPPTWSKWKHLQIWAHLFFLVNVCRLTIEVCRLKIHNHKINARLKKEKKTSPHVYCISTSLSTVSMKMPSNLINKPTGMSSSIEKREED